MAKSLEKIEGVIYSLPLEIAMNIFRKNKTVFVKYLPHEPTRKTESRLKEGMKLYIYVSKANKSIIGEAIIREVSYLNLDKLLKKFRKKIMVSETELILYADGREDKKAQVLELKEITLYKKETPVRIPLTMSGIYVTKENKKRVFGR